LILDGEYMKPLGNSLGVIFWIFVGLLLVNLFTNVVTDHTCHDRNKESAMSY